MSDDTRERFLDLSEQEAMDQLDEFGREQLDQIRRVYGVVDS
jgi:hypothetical protein